MVSKPDRIATGNGQGRRNSKMMCTHCVYIVPRPPPRVQCLKPKIQDGRRNAMQNHKLPITCYIMQLGDIWEHMREWADGGQFAIVNYN